MLETCPKQLDNYRSINALAEFVIGLFKTEVIRQKGPWRSLEDVEFAVLEWVWWFNHHRLFEPIGYLPPAEYEESFSVAERLKPSKRYSTNTVSEKNGVVQSGISGSRKAANPRSGTGDAFGMGVAFKKGGGVGPGE